MICDGYINRNSVLHTASPSLKIIILSLFCTGVFLLNTWQWVAVACGITMLGYKVAKLNFQYIFQGIRPTFTILSLIFVCQALSAGLPFATFVLLRFTSLILAANLLTMTTRSSEFVDGIMALLRHAPRWVAAEKIALAISLSLRFIPLIRTVFEEIRLAQRARGLDKNLLALLNPLVVRTLKSGDQIVEAIHARSPER